MDLFEHLLVSLNQVLASITVILAVSLLGFIIAYNRKSTIGRSFSLLLACLCITYASDVALFQVGSLQSAIQWLKFQWIGIAFTPAAYLHFSDALLRTTNVFSQVQRLSVLAAYGLGGIFLYLAVGTDLLVKDGFFSPGVTQFRSGPYFWLFSLYFGAVVVWGLVNTIRARTRCLTSATRRRVTHLAISFFAPACGVFPYMLVASQTQLLPTAVLLIILFTVNIGIAIMIMLMAYTVSLFAAFAPDRVVKYRLGTHLLRGSLVAILVTIVILILPDRPIILGLPRDAVLTSLIVGIIVLAPLASNYLKPTVSRIIYWNERDEVELLRTIDMRLVTTTDLQQALENVLTAICDLLRVRVGFVANLSAQSGPRLEATTGSFEAVETALTKFSPDLFQVAQQAEGSALFTAQNKFWYVPLQTEARDHYLGLIGVEARSERIDLTPQETQVVASLIEKAEQVLEDRRLQQKVFQALRGIVSDLERSQQVRSAVRYMGSPIENLLREDSLELEPNFVKLVQEALSHYWGGPKLTNSPLMHLKVVQQAIDDHDGNTVKALRSVLGKAIEDMRPNGERKMTGAEWLFYNILELKFIRGLKVRDIAGRLAMSEADFYRKQKIAIQAVAQALSEMERRDQ